MNDLEKILNDKQRIVFTGSEGGDFTAAVCRHVLHHSKRACDFIADGVAVEQTNESPLALIVAGEAITENGQPEFLTYRHHIGVITAIQYSAGNGFSSEEAYIRQYDQFADATPKGGLLVYSELDPVASVLCNKERPDVTYLSFKAHAHAEDNGDHFLVTPQRDRIPVAMRSRKDLLWFSAAREILKKLGVTPEQFFSAIPTFRIS